MRRCIIILLATIVLIGCDKHKDPIPASIVDKWQITGATTKLQVGGKSLKDFLVGMGMPAAEAQQAADEAQKDADLDGTFSGIFEFKADGAWIGTIHDDDNDTDDTTTGTWSLSDDRKTLTLTNDDADSNNNDEGSDPMAATIVTLTDTDLQLDVLVGSEDDVFQIDYLVSLTLKRIIP